jgi:hypothetical protein
MWSQKVIDRFRAVPQNPRENDFYGPYNKLLYSIFPVDSDFTVAPQSYPIPQSRDSIDFIIEYVVLLNNMPVFILEIKEPSRIDLLSARQDADIQMRKRLRDLRFRCTLDRLYGVSAFGEQLCIYNIDTDNNIEPHIIPQDVELLIDTAPRGRWNYGILTPSGHDKLVKIFDYIKESVP